MNEIKGFRCEYCGEIDFNHWICDECYKLYGKELKNEAQKLMDNSNPQYKYKKGRKWNLNK
jgi:ribosomal protein L32